MPVDPGRLYFKLVYWREEWEAPRDILYVWVGEGADEIKLDGALMRIDKWDNYPSQLTDKYFGKDKLIFRCPTELSLPFRIRCPSEIGKRHLDILWTRTFPLFSQRLVDALLEGGIAITHKEITLCDFYGKPLDAASRAEYGPPYHHVLFPRQEELDLGGTRDSPGYKPFYNGKDDVFSDIQGLYHIVTFPVVEIIRKHRLRKVRVKGPFNVFPNRQPDEHVKGKWRILTRIQQLPDLKVPQKQWPGEWMKQYQELGYRD